MKHIQKAFIFFAIAIVFASFKQGETTWVAIGDSITYLNDHPDETGNRVTKGYLTRVTEKFPGMKYVNKGFNGWTSGNIAQHIDSLSIPYGNVYSVFLGTNDWWQGRPIGTMEDFTDKKGNGSVYGSFRIIIDKLHSLNPDAKIVLITPMQRGDFVYIADHKNNAYGSYKPKNGVYLEAFADAIKNIGEHENIPVVDLYHNNALKVENLVNFSRLKDPQTGAYTKYKYPQYTNIPFDPQKDDYPYPPEAIKLTYDGLHPADRGNAIVAKAVEKVFKKLGI